MTAFSEHFHSPRTLSQSTPKLISSWILTLWQPYRIISGRITRSNQKQTNLDHKTIIIVVIVITAIIIVIIIVVVVIIIQFYNVSFSKFCTFTFTYPLTAGLVGALRMTSLPVSSIHCRLGLGELQACLFLDVFPPLFLSSLSSSLFHCALQGGFGQPDLMNGRDDHTNAVCLSLRWSGGILWSDCLLDLGADFHVGNMVFVRDVSYLAVAPHFHGLYSISHIPLCWKKKGLLLVLHVML